MKAIKNLSKESLEIILERMLTLLSDEQYREMEKIIENAVSESADTQPIPLRVRMSQEFVDEKMEQIKNWMEQIDEGELYLNIEEYEDYSSGYWDREWITEYYDNQGIGDKIMTMIRFVKDCIDDRKYQEANFICEWLWEMSVSTDSEYDSELVDLEMLFENKIIQIDLEQFALQTLYADYQVQLPENRAQDIFLYLGIGAFQKLHIEDIFQVGIENLTGQEQFWKDWIALLKTKRGSTASRLLEEAILFREGINGLVKLADEHGNEHPALYLAAMKEYEKKHDYLQIEEIGQKAVKKLDVRWIIRSEAALKAAYASSYLGHKEEMMQFCWESFCSNSTKRNFLRLFGMKEMAELYGMRGNEVLENRIKGNPEGYVRDTDLQQNIMGDYGYLTLCFYTGNFKQVKEASRNPKGSLGWSGSFIRYGIRLFLLYLYDEILPSKAAAAVSGYVGFPDSGDYDGIMDFEREICEESKRHKTSMFWNYFQRWKPYFPMEQSEKKKYLEWTEPIVYGRADAIVGGQRRNHYGESAQLLAMVGDVKESLGVKGAKNEIFAVYKKKFPRHSSFQQEMKTYFGF